MTEDYYKNNLDNVLYNISNRTEKIKDGLIIGGALTGLVLGAVTLYTIIGAGVGALMGEILDRIPYFNYAIPRAIEELAGSDWFYGNLDKLGAALGFIGSFFRSYTKCDKKSRIEDIYTIYRLNDYN